MKHTDERQHSAAAPRRIASQQDSGKQPLCLRGKKTFYIELGGTSRASLTMGDASYPARTMAHHVRHLQSSTDLPNYDSAHMQARPKPGHNLMYPQILTYPKPTSANKRIMSPRTK